MNAATQSECGLPPLAVNLVADARGLVSPPEICLKVAELAQASDTSVTELGEVIIRDPNLTARLLRLVNSPYYGLRGEIDTVSRAVMVIGTQELYSLVIAITAVRSFSMIPNGLVNIDTFWRHGIYAGLIARVLARRCHVLHPERLFIGGLLHDIGSLILYHRLPEISRNLILAANGDEEVLHEAERQELGFSHADLGALLLASWHIPITLQDAIRWHHCPGEATIARLEAAILHVSNVLANRSGIGGFCENTRDDGFVDERALRIIGLSSSEIDASGVIAEAGEHFTQTAAILAAA